MGIKTPFIIFTGKGKERVAMDALNRGSEQIHKEEQEAIAAF